MKDIKKVAVIGHFGGDNTFLDGQTVKTKNFVAALKGSSNWDVECIDTFYKKRKPFTLLKKIQKACKEHDDIFVMPSSRGLSLIMFVLKKYIKCRNLRVHHIVIGGMFPSYLKKHKKALNIEHRFTSIWIETLKLKIAMNELGFNNVFLFPNFKMLKPLQTPATYDSKVFRFCMFSRVIPEKGIELAINSLKSFYKEGKQVLLDIYGPVDSGYKDSFSKIVEENKDFVEYKGVINQNEIPETLKNYYMLLFPTYWKGEGFPGTILDAFIAGIPVISSDWNCNTEVVTNMFSGLVYPSSSFGTLDEAIDYSLYNKEKIIAMRDNCLLEYRKYFPNEIIKKVIEFIQSLD